MFKAKLVAFWPPGGSRTGKDTIYYHLMKEAIAANVFANSNRKTALVLHLCMQFSVLQLQFAVAAAG